MKELYELIKSNCKALYKAGSLSIPFIKNNRDEEYLIVCDTFEEFMECLNTIRSNFSKTKRKISLKQDSLPLKIKVWAPNYHYAFLNEHYGENIDWYDYNILDHKKEYVDVLIDFYTANEGFKDKKYYHVLLGLYILDNNSYDLTEKQQEEVQLAHDGEISDEAKDYIRKKIRYYQANYDLIDLSETELEIYNLKKKLADTDYQAIKFAEGELTIEEFTPIKEQRIAWRNRINELTNK